MSRHALATTAALVASAEGPSGLQRLQARKPVALADSKVPDFHPSLLRSVRWLLEKEWDDPTSRQGILFAARVLEQEPTALALNSHLLVVGRRV